MFNMHGYCKYKVSISNVVTLDGRQIEIEYDDVCGEDEDECDDGRGENEDDDDADSYTSTRYVNDDATDNDEDIDYEDDCELQEEVKQEVKQPCYLKGVNIMFINKSAQGENLYTFKFNNDVMPLVYIILLNQMIIIVGLIVI